MKCDQCGKEFEGRFCPECGTEVPEVDESQAAPETNTVKCQQCGKEFEGKFCPECGAKVPENGKTKCSKCSKEFEGKFCPECGTKSGGESGSRRKAGKQAAQQGTHLHDYRGYCCDSGDRHGCLQPQERQAKRRA